MEFTPTKDHPILITPEAVDYLVQSVEASGVDVLRLGVLKTYCCASPFIEFCTEMEDDTVLQFEKFKLVIDNNDLTYLFGVIICLQDDQLMIVSSNKCSCNRNDCDPDCCSNCVKED